jgi:hypothetical protein
LLRRNHQKGAGGEVGNDVCDPVAPEHRRHKHRQDRANAECGNQQPRHLAMAKLLRRANQQ